MFFRQASGGKREYPPDRHRKQTFRYQELYHTGLILQRKGYAPVSLHVSACFVKASIQLILSQLFFGDTEQKLLIVHTFLLLFHKKYGGIRIHPVSFPVRQIQVTMRIQCGFIPDSQLDMQHIIQITGSRNINFIHRGIQHFLGLQDDFRKIFRFHFRRHFSENA